jgi:hypothetical protein
MVALLLALAACVQNVGQIDRVPESREEPIKSIADAPHEELEGCLATLAGLPPEFESDRRANEGQLIVVFKRQKSLGLYRDGSLVEGACWDIALGSWPYEAKVRRDNASTPEGWYTVSYKRTSNPLDTYPDTAFYKALHVSYPNAQDIVWAKRLGVINDVQAEELLDAIKAGRLPSQSSPMGGAILIHGWMDELPETLGCVGMREPEIDLLFPQVEAGTPILFLPWHRIIRQDRTFGVDPVPSLASR